MTWREVLTLALGAAVVGAVYGLMRSLEVPLVAGLVGFVRAWVP